MADRDDLDREERLRNLESQVSSLATSTNSLVESVRSIDAAVEKLADQVTISRQTPWQTLASKP